MRGIAPDGWCLAITEPSSMYTLSIPGTTLSTSSLVGLFTLFRDERVRATATAQIELGGAPAGVSVTRYNGVLALRQPGTAGQILAAMFAEHRDAEFVEPDGAQRQSWQVVPAAWDGLFAFHDVCRQPQLLLSSDQIETEDASARSRGTRFFLSDLSAEALLTTFGFAACGPAIPGTRETNSRHEVQVAYALAQNLPVPDRVLDAYREDSEAFRYGLEWAGTLIQLPELRGAIPVEKLRPILGVMRGEGKAVDANNADVLTMLARLLPAQPTYPQVDDLLHSHGLIDDLALPDSFGTPVDIGEPVTPLAERVRERVATLIRDRSIAHADGELKAGHISRRAHRERCDVARLQHGRHSFEQGNRLARALANRDVGTLLETLDRADEHNRGSKQAFYDTFGVKLIGVRAAQRRRAIFSLCGHTEEEQAAWERDAVQRKAERDAQRDLADAREIAGRARYVGAMCGEISGAEHVDRAINDGYSKIESFRRGAARVYALVRGTEREGRRLSAQDGTLAYARAVLEQRAA
ncbi:hypothetical protein [Paraburkholderia tropica]|nr:hypothetical protein [Paraburkholderia tropica]